LGWKAGWAWIFILEGIVTVLFGIASVWMVHDFPDLATFLSDQDRARVVRRLKMDQQSSAEHEEFKMKYIWMAMKDYKMWYVLHCIFQPISYFLLSKPSPFNLFFFLFSFLFTNEIPRLYTPGLVW